MNKSINKLLSLVMVIAILMSLAAPAAAATAELLNEEPKYGYIALGDAMTNGVGLNDPKTEAYYAKVAKALGMENDYKKHANNRYRVEELRYLLDSEYAGDGYTQSILGLSGVRNAGYVKTWVKNAEVITVNVGINNFSTYLIEQMVYYVENKGATKYSYSFDEFFADDVQDALENVQSVVMEQLLAAAPDVGDTALELINFVTEVSTYAMLSYTTSFNAMVSSIYELNPDVELYVIGIYNPAQDEMLSFSNGERTVELPVGDLFGALVELANAYSQILAPRAYDYTYVDAGNPELLIDQMGNKNLSIEDRVPVDLKSELLYAAEDTAVSMIQEMFAQYGVTKTYNEALKIAEEIFYAPSDEYRMDYIKNQIYDLVVVEVLDRFETELENYAGTYGDIDVTQDDIRALLTDLDNAADVAAREGVAEEFVVDLMTKAMIGQTFAGMYIATQQDAYDAIELLENNSSGDPDALREMAADMIYAKVGDNGLNAYITRNDVLNLLEQLDTTTTTAEREVIIKNWMNELAVKKITQKIREIQQTCGMTVSYSETDARNLLAAMEADSANAESIAKNHMLTTGGFHTFMVTKFTETYTTNGLTLQTYASFEAFVTAVENAATNEEAKAIVREEIRQAAAAQVVANDLYQTFMCQDQVLQDRIALRGGITGLFAGMDAKNTDAEKDAYLFDWLCYCFGGDATPTAGVISLANMLKPVFQDAYASYNNAATAAEDAFTTYRNGVNQASEAFAQYNSLKVNAAQQILDAYETSYKGAGETALGYYADYLALKKAAVTKVMDGYEQYQDAITKGMDSCDQLNDKFDKVFSLLCEIAEVEVVSLNDILSVAKKITGNASYINEMVENLVQGDKLASEDKTVAYLALRYYLADAMMIMPSAKGHATIANQVIRAINGENTGSTAGNLANKVINGGLDIYHAAKDFLSRPTNGSGQADVLINPENYVAFGDNITSGTALNDGELTYVQMLANALAMEYNDVADFDKDLINNFALNGMRTEELLALVTDYNGDAYTEARFGVDYIESLRAQYRDHIANAELITINVGINNLVTYPMTQALLAYNGEETYEMDWAQYFAQSRVDKVYAGKNFAMRLLLSAVDTAENRVAKLDEISAYEKCERILNTVSIAVESLAYGLLGYAVNLDASVEAIAEMNEDATIVLVGFYNPMVDTYINIDKAVTIGDKTLDLSKFTINTSALTDKVINIANRFLTNYVGFIGTDETAADAGSRIVSVSVLDAELCVSDMNVSKDLSTLADWTTVSVRGREITIKIPEYFLATRTSAGAALHPNQDGHQYICDRILQALKYEIHADVVIQDAEKAYGAADPTFTYLMDDCSSLYDELVLSYTREPGEEPGQYTIKAEITNEGYYIIDNGDGTYVTYAYDGEDGYFEVDVIFGTLTILDQPVQPITGSFSAGNWTMSLDSVVYLNYYPVMNGFDGADLSKDAGVVVWTGEGDITSREQLYVGAENTITIEGMEQNEEGKWFVRTDEIFAKNLGDMVFIRLYVEDGVGGYIYSPAYFYSPAWYCYDMLADDFARDDTQNVCAALLHYGAAAQLYFNYKTDDLVDIIPSADAWAERTMVTLRDGSKVRAVDYWANIDLSDYDALLTFDATYLDSLYVDNHIKGLANTLEGVKQGVSINGGVLKPTLDLQGAIRLTVGCNIDTSVINLEGATAEVLFWNQSSMAGLTELTAQNADYVCSLTKATGEEGEVYVGDYRAISDHILAKNLSDTVYYSVRIVTSDGTVYRSGLGYYSPEAFVADTLADSGSNAHEVCERIAVYGEMARIRFLENNN